MPRVGSKQSSVLKPLASHRAITTFCWLPPLSRLSSDPARVSICRREMAEIDAAPLGAHPDRPPVADAGEARQRDILPNRALLQERQQPVRRHQNDAGADGVRGMAQPQFLAAGEDGAFVRAATAGDAVEQFLLPLPFQRRDAQNLARIELERNVVEQRAAA